MAIAIQRVYDVEEAPPGRSFLVDRYWPRGVKKADLAFAEWTKDAAPSRELIRWFGHDPEKWEEFRERYKEELRRRPDGWAPLAEAARDGDITLLFAARDREHNNAVVLREHLMQTT